MASKYPELVFKADEDFDEKRLNAAMQVLDQRLMALEPFSPQWQAAISDLQRFGLDRLNDAIQPIYDRLTVIGQIGAMFTATSTTQLTIGIAPMTLTVSADDMGRFAASGYLTIQSANDPSNSMSGQMVVYNRKTGVLVVDVDSVRGEGTFSKWTISAAVDPVLIDERFAVVQSAIDDFKAQVLAEISTFGPNDQSQINANTAAISALQTLSAGIQADIAKLKKVTLRGYLFATMR